MLRVVVGEDRVEPSQPSATTTTRLPLRSKSASLTITSGMGCDLSALKTDAHQRCSAAEETANHGDLLPTALTCG
jgi:hypothetical protein